MPTDSAAATVSVATSPLALAGLGVTVRPAGAPLTAKFTGPVNPFTRVMLMAAVCVLPCGTVSEAGAMATEKLGSVELKVAVTWLLPPTVGVNVHVVAPLTQPPDQPAKVLLLPGVWVSVTGTALNGAVHVLPQFSPAGFDVTVPVPEPARVTLTDGPKVWRLMKTESGP